MMASEQAPTKGVKIKNVLKSAARIPRIPYIKGRKGMRRDFAPRPGEAPFVLLRIQVLSCTNLLAKDRGGTSDPFVVVSILNDRHQTPVVKKSLNPVYNPKDATFDFPIYLSLADKIGVIELVVWDKDLLKKDYLGEISVPLDDWFIDRMDNKDKAYSFDQPANELMSLDLASTRSNTASTGSIQIKIGFIPVPNSNNLMDFDEIYAELLKRSRPSLMSAAPTEGVGTVRSNPFDNRGLQDDGGLSSDTESSDDEEEFVDATDTTPPSSSSISPKPLSEVRGQLTRSPEPTRDPEIASSSTTQPKLPPQLAELTIESSSPSTPTADLSTAIPTLGIVEPTPKAGGGFAVPSPTTGGKFNPRNFVRKLSGFTSSGSAPNSPLVDSSGTATAALVAAPPIARSASKERRLFGRNKVGSGYSSSSGTSSGAENALTNVTTPTTPLGALSTAVLGAGKRRESYYEYKRGNDIMGIVLLEIQGAENLPKWANMMHTGWDMDPCVVISFGKKVFRTRVIRHSLNPVWDEKMLFHVRRYEKSFRMQFTILDWDKLSSNDYVGEASLDLKELLDCVPQPDPITGLYPFKEEDNVTDDMKEFRLPLSMQKSSVWQHNNPPVIKFRAKYQSYDSLRQRFWRQYLCQYDTDDTCAMSQVELRSMLDSLGSTLTKPTITSFYTRFGKNADEDEITIDQAVQCLEEELGRPVSEKRHIDVDESIDTSVSATPLLLTYGPKGEKIDLESLDFSGPAHVAVDTNPSEFKPRAPPPQPTEGVQRPLMDVIATEGAVSGSDIEGDSSSTPAIAQATKAKKARFQGVRRIGKKKKGTSGDSSSSDDSVERVINVKNCPLCHRARLNDKAEMDIITHLAICASRDWHMVDQIMVGNFVTASQAQRKWYTKIIGKLSAGDYRLGANSANIIVQNRLTGQLEEEKMQVYVRLGIRLLYKGASGRMEGARARRLLKSLSIKQGIKYDNPESAKDIPTFIQFHILDVGEILDPLDSFKTFNEFFYRKLKADARPVEQSDDPNRLVSGADCRLMAFATVTEATRLWIKGRDFTVARLLGDVYKAETEKYIGGALCIFRLAPQDYHRFHSPVDGIIGPMTYISGEYYTVNPQAIRSALDVYGENARKIVPIDSPQFGRVFAVCVGAMMVGSIQTTVNEGDQIKRGQEFGYFAFGGSTIVLLFEKDKVVWDEDLLINGRASLETLVRVGMGIGNRRSA